MDKCLWRAVLVVMLPFLLVYSAIAGAMAYVHASLVALRLAWK